MYLTIEKFCPVSRSRIIMKKVGLVLILLVVPLVIIAAWFLLSIHDNLNLAQAAIAVPDQISNQTELISY